jgi:hypothetical protein
MSQARALVIGLVVALTLVGCARPGGDLLPRPGTTGATALPGRLLVVARQTSPDNRGIADRTATLVAQGLRPAGEVWMADDLVREATVAEAAPWALALVERLSLGGWPTVDDRVDLLKFAITGLVVTEVTTYDQVWGKYAKFTRVAVEARAFDVASGSIAWRLSRGVEIEDVRGRAFEYATESAVNALLAAIFPGTQYSVVDLWRVWRR